MNNWFIVKVKYTKMLSNGTFKRVSEPFVLSAYSFSDAEARIYEELGSIIRGEFNVVSITRAELHDIFAAEDCDVWHKATISFKSEGDDVEKSKKVKQHFLIAAPTVKDSDTILKEELSTLMVDYTIDSITITPIVDVFPYKEELDRILPTEEDYKSEEIVDELPR